METSINASDELSSRLITNTARLRTRLLTAKQPTKIAFWNVRTMSQLLKTEQVLGEMKQYNIEILALSEIRWKGVAHQTLDDGYVLLHSGEDNHHRTGVELMISPTAVRTMIKWTPINERILFARLAKTH